MKLNENETNMDLYEKFMEEIETHTCFFFINKPFLKTCRWLLCSLHHRRLDHHLRHLDSLHRRRHHYRRHHLDCLRHCCLRRHFPTDHHHIHRRLNYFCFYFQEETSRSMAFTMLH